MIYKTVKEFEEETALSKTQQLNAQKICVRKGVLQVSYRKIPPKRHFKVDFKRVCDLLEESGGKKRVRREVVKWLETRHSNVRHGVRRISHFLPNITESTQESTSKKKSYFDKGNKKAKIPPDDRSTSSTI